MTTKRTGVEMETARRCARGVRDASPAIRALLNGALALASSGLITACSAAADDAPRRDWDTAGVADVAGGPAGSSFAGTGNGGGDAHSNGAGGVGTGATAGVGTGGAGTGGAGTGAAAGEGTDGFGTGGVDTGSGGAGTGGVGAGGSAPGTGGVGTGGPEGIGGPTEGNQVTCSPIVGGMSTVVVNGTPRVFNVQMPANTSRMALLFLWHGWLQMPSTFANEIVYDAHSGRWVAFDPNAFPMPLMIVTPWDTKLIPPAGLDWDIVSGTVDFPFFEAMLQCIQEQFDIDENRLYSMGFSAGAVFTNLLAAKYPHLFAATISESGAWFNDQTQWSDVAIPIIQWQWPGFNPADRGNVLLTQGGPNDFATVISLHNTNLKALPFLHHHGRTVVECTHTFGHSLDPDLTQRMYYDYMWAHHRGGPPLAGLPPGFPTHDRPVGATRCYFHPAP